MIEKLAAYPEYKEPGLPWLGLIPKHWVVNRCKSIFEKIDVRSTTGKEELLTVSSAHGVIPRRNATVTMFKAESYRGYKLCWPGDLVINSLWAWAGGLGVSQHHGIVSSAYGVYRLREGSEASPAFINQVVRSSPFNWELHVRSKGIWTSRLQLTDESFLDAPFYLPPEEEQSAIVRFLNHTNAKIDRAIRAKKKLIALLNEQKQSIIHRAVTRGLNPTVTLRASGVDWLGKIPQHWRISTLSRLCSRIGDGLHGTPQFVDKSQYHFINGNNLSHGDIRLRASTRCVSKEEFNKHKVALDHRSVLMSINGTIGNVARYRDEEVILGKSAAYINCGEEISAAFLIRYLESPAVVDFLRKEVTGTTIFNLSLESIRALATPLPPLEEQLKTASAIGEMTEPLIRRIVSFRQGCMKEG